MSNRLDNVPRHEIGDTAMLRLAVLLLAISAGAAHAQSAAYFAGLADRTSIEAWLASLSGPARAGAEYWAGQRSLPKPGSCFGPEGQASAEWSLACQAAQQRLAPTDVRRKSEPDYRLGWNSFVATTVPAAAAAPQVPADADCRLVAPPAGPTSGTIGPAVASRLVIDCEARKRVAQEKAEAERNEAAFRAEAARAAYERAALEERRAADQAAAESSPDNRCRKPDFAGSLISTVNEMKGIKSAANKVIDIEHLVTRKWDPDTMDVVCHGVFVFENDARISSTVEMRPNVAGEMLTWWMPDR